MLDDLKAKFGLPLTEYVKPLPSGAVATPSAAPSTTVQAEEQPDAEHAAVANVDDQGSTAEVPLLDRAVIDASLHCLLEREPVEREEVTDAFKRRVDGGRLSSARLQRAGSSSRLWSIGPERRVPCRCSLALWEKCHQVRRKLAIGCGVAHISTLDTWRTKFEGSGLCYSWRTELAAWSIGRGSATQINVYMQTWSLEVSVREIRECLRAIAASTVDCCDPGALVSRTGSPAFSSGTLLPFLFITSGVS